MSCWRVTWVNSKLLGLNSLPERVWTELLTYGINFRNVCFSLAILLRALSHDPYKQGFKQQYFFNSSSCCCVWDCGHCLRGVKWNWTSAEVITLLCQVIVTNNARSIPCFKGGCVVSHQKHLLFFSKIFIKFFFITKLKSIKVVKFNYLCRRKNENSWYLSFAQSFCSYM